MVTGGTGFLGGWLVKRLLAAGAVVVCPVRDWVPHSLLLKEELEREVILARGDLTDQLFMERVLGEYEISTVFHLAAQSIVPIANRNPVSTFESNIKGTWSLLEACRRNPTVEQVVLASSDKAYGRQEDLPYDEEMPLKGVYPYDVSKACSEMLAKSYQASFGLKVAVTRCGNFYGGGDLNWNRLVPGTVRALFRGHRPIIRSDGHFVRDYFYIEDGAAAYMLLAEKLASNPDLAGEAFNFSTEERLSVLELVCKIIEVMGASVEPDVRGEAINEIREQSLSAKKAREILGWQPLFSLEESLERTVDWYKKYLRHGH
ncbi:MAG: GDP-mannose 4,6-dehydratase [Bacillota bacterium]